MTYLSKGASAEGPSGRYWATPNLAAPSSGRTIRRSGPLPAQFAGVAVPTGRTQAGSANDAVLRQANRYGSPARRSGDGTTKCCSRSVSFTLAASAPAVRRAVTRRRFSKSDALRCRRIPIDDVRQTYPGSRLRSHKGRQSAAAPPR